MATHPDPARVDARPGALPGDRCQRLHRRQARPRAARRRPPGALPRPHPGEPPGASLGGPGRGGQGGRHRRGEPAARVPRCGRGVLPGALTGLRARFRGDRPACRPDLRRTGPRRRGAPHRLPRRPHPGGRPRAGALPASALTGRGRPDPARLRGPRHRPAGRRRDRLRLRLLRDAPLPHRTAARDGDAELGRDPRPAHRRTRRAALPRRQRDHAAGRQPEFRHRRPGHPHLPGHDGPLRGGRRTAPAAHPAGPHAHPAPVQPLDRPRHPRARRPRPPARRVPAVRGRLRRARHRRVRTRPARRPGLLRQGPGPRPPTGPGGPGHHPLVLRLTARSPQRSAAHRPRLGGRQPLHR